MKISVLIPAFNAASTIGDALDSVLSQTRSPAETIVLDDGCTDETAKIVSAYSPKVTLHRQTNQGVGAARNVLCKLAQGDLLAFLDSDDVWHPRYLEIQHGFVDQFPDAGAFFTGHTLFSNAGGYNWPTDTLDLSMLPETLDPLSFFSAYNRAPGRFFLSFCCLPRRTMFELGEDSCGDNRLVEDAYMLCQFALIGRPVIYYPEALAAYRLTPGSLSSNRLTIYQHSIKVFEALEERFQQAANPQLRQEFKRAFAIAHRTFGKYLMGAGQETAARGEFREASLCANDPVSFTKSIGLLTTTYLPASLQPAWPASQR
jgi:glycosyltransferase involved in cell wall biosynthesis